MKPLQSGRARTIHALLHRNLDGHSPSLPYSLFHPWVLVCWWLRFPWSFARFIAPAVATTFIVLSSNKTCRRRFTSKNGRYNGERERVCVYTEIMSRCSFIVPPPLVYGALSDAARLTSVCRVHRTLLENREAEED